VQAFLQKGKPVFRGRAQELYRLAERLGDGRIVQEPARGELDDGLDPLQLAKDRKKVGEPG